MSNEEHIGDLVESLLVLENEKLMSQSQAILNGCAVWTPSPPFRAFLEQFVLAVERFTIETKHINLGFVTLFFYSIFLIEGLEQFSFSHIIILGIIIPIH